MSQNAELPEPNGQVSDAYDGNWVDRYAPAGLRPYLRLSRADRPIGTWLLLLPCWWGLMLAAMVDGLRIFDLWIVVGCAIGAFVMRGAGCTWNDITDRDIDGHVERTRSRPIPSGQVSVKQAAIWLVFQLLIGLGILLTFNMASFWVGAASLIPVAIYPFAKRFTWWPQFFLGIAFNWGVLLAWTAHSGSLGMPAIVLYAAGIIWTLFYDTIYAHQDKEDDALIGVKSTARLFAENTKNWLYWFWIGATMLTWVALVMTTLQPSQVIVAMTGIVAFAAHLQWQIMRLDIDDTALCLRLFRSNRDAGLLIALFFAFAALL
ncbi:MAG: 4-hydroxybenzoate octaprenyltransferase [Halocynthiibacter sp.]